jgi:hypothetical protein
MSSRDPFEPSCVGGNVADAQLKAGFGHDARAADRTPIACSVQRLVISSAF